MSRDVYLEQLHDISWGNLLLVFILLIFQEPLIGQEKATQEAP